MPRGRDPHNDPPPFRAPRAKPPPVPTLGDLRKGSCWLWVMCLACSHQTPTALAPLIIRLGADASSDVVRRSARCSRCGARSARLQHPSWIDTNVGFQPFPVVGHS